MCGLHGISHGVLTLLHILKHAVLIVFVASWGQAARELGVECKCQKISQFKLLSLLHLTMVLSSQAALLLLGILHEEPFTAEMLI